MDRIENNTRDKMRHLKCVCFLRPTAASIEKLIQELRDPCYGDYYLCKIKDLFHITTTKVQWLMMMNEWLIPSYWGLHTRDVIV